uniref:BRISC and BRCA1-A complex member 1 n=1 Tax=Phallusia mammillata TaxID=59560 RepID=A0A6F9D7L0_9ASCI|nr:BRISC and BRCA1-A complex member 1-like [Phallusia mammillata]
MASNDNSADSTMSPPPYSADSSRHRRSPQEHDEVLEQDKGTTEPQTTVQNTKNLPQNKESPSQITVVDSNVEGHRSPSPRPEPKPRVVLKRLSSSSQDNIPIPKVNCPEKIILCVDHSSSMFLKHFRKTAQTIKQTSPIQVLNGAIRQFVMTKSLIDKRHEYSLFMLNDNAQLISDFSNQANDIMFMMQDITNTTKPKENQDTEGQSSVDISQLFDQIENHVTLPVVKNPSQTPPPYVVRLIFIYGRSQCKIEFLNGRESYQKLVKSPYFFMDSIYIHEEPSEDNKVTDVFTGLCELDANGNSYILEVGLDSSMSVLYNALAKLLAHPLQRQRQPVNFNYDILSLE